MKTITGLGNPGEKYKESRHNAGFRAIDLYAKENSFPEFKTSKKFDSLISEKGGLVLQKPQTFMNNSGKAVKEIVSYYKIDLSDLVVIHDDIDLKTGEIKVVRNRGSAGHKGVDSIITHLKTKDFTRIRIGVQPKEGKPENTDEFVLQKFAEEEKEIIEESLEEAMEKIADILG